MKLLSSIIFVSLFSTQLFAAQFSKISEISSPAAKILARTGLNIVKNQEVFGDVGRVVALNFTRKVTETDMATVKQLSYKNGATSDDYQEDFQNVSVKKIVEFALYAVENQEADYAADFKAARINLTNALNIIKADKTLKIYGNQHADEDGSWNILYILDTKTNQILVVVIGFSGT
jgi:hypothetical protein